MFNSNSSNTLDESEPNDKDKVEPVVQFEPNIITILDTIPEPMIIIDQSGKLVLTNHATKKLFNYTETELLNSVIEDLIPECLTEQINQTIKSMRLGEAATFAFHGLNKSLEKFPVEVSVNPLTIHETMFILVGMRDLTRQQLYQQSLKEKSDELAKQLAITSTTVLLNKQQEEFINTVCQKLNNPLTRACNTIPMLIKSFNNLRLANARNQQLSEETTPLFEESENYLEIIEQCAEQKKNILNNIQTLLKLENNKVELNISQVELTDIIKNTLLIFSAKFKQKRLTLLLDLPKNPVWLKTDPYQLSQIVINLMSNAVKFTEVGYVTFTAAVEPTLDLFAENVIINFIVKDTGIGMLPQEINNLFQRFTQATNSHASEKHGGVGLGLIISKKIIELMGGTIQVESRIGEGTQFSFSIKGSYLTEEELLDAIQTTSLLNNSHLKIITSSLNGKKILIVENHQINTTMLVRQLKQAGCICCTAIDGQIALELYTQNRFDLICMEIEIPIINGLEVTKKIRDKELLLDYHTIIIGMSGYSSASKKQLALQNGMDDYITKPYTPKELLEKILEHVLLQDTCQPNNKDERKRSVKPSFPLNLSPSFGSQSSSTSNSFRPLASISTNFTPNSASRDVTRHTQTDITETTVARKETNRCIIS